MNNTIRKHPRTLTEAFGPYTSQRIDEPVHVSDRIVTWVSAVALVAFVCIMFIWG
jgi:hypothetical protein